MHKTNKRFLVFAFMVIVVLCLYFCSGEIMNSSMNVKMNENVWLGVNSWWWFSTLDIIFFGAAIYWLLYRNKKLTK